MNMVHLCNNNNKNNMKIYCAANIGKCWKLHLLKLWILWTLFVNISIGNATTQVMQKLDPTFLSQSEAFKFPLGDTITLPCDVKYPGTFMLAWKRGSAILTAGNVIVSPDNRIRLANAYTLQIKDASVLDAGDYICQIATIVPKEITHHVEILEPPKIHTTSGRHLQVRKGSPVRLECAADGNPAPNITWTRKNNLLPNGEEKFVSPFYVIENMDRHKGGTYICTANNGVGAVATSQIVLHVLYPPEISVEAPIVYSGDGQEALLVCIVHGESQPEVSWFHDTMQVDQTERHTMESRGARHTLQIRKVSSMDLGNYSCTADNQLGKTRKTITLTGRPKAALFRSAPISQWKDKYNVSWSVESFAPIEEHKLYYRVISHRTSDAHQMDANFFQQKNKQLFGNGDPGDNFHQPHQDYTNFDPFQPGNNFPSNMPWNNDEWREIVIPGLSYTVRYLQGANYMLRGLEPDQQYEAKVITRNRYGWSDFSERFLFTTSNTDTEIRDMSVTHYSTSSTHSSPNRLHSRSLELLAILTALSSFVLQL